MVERSLLISFFVKSLLVFFGLVLVSGCGVTDTSNQDVTPPSVVSTVPAVGNTVPLNAPLSVTFSEGVNADSFTVVSSSGIPVRGTMTGIGTATLTFTPASPYNYSRTYTATIANVRDGSGNRLGNVTWSFTSASASLNYHITPDSHYYDVGTYNSIAVSPLDGKSYISYFNVTTQSLYVISTADGTTFEGPVMVDGPTGTENVGTYSSLAIDSAGNLHVSYYHEGVGLIYATAPTLTDTWSKVVVDSGGGTAAVGRYTSLTLDGNGKAHISYYDETNTALKYATNTSGTWTNETVDSGLSEDNPGQYTSIKVAADGVVHISYYDYHASVNNGNLKYVRGNSGTWSTPATLDSTGDVGQFSSLALYQGKVYITYNHMYPDGRSFIRIITNASDEWKHYDIVQVGQSTSGSGNLTANPLAIDADGLMNMSYYNGGVLYYSTGVLVSAALNIWDWAVAEAVDTSEVGQGTYTSLALDSHGNVRIAYYDATDGDLKFAQ